MSEIMSLSIMSWLIPSEIAPYCNLLWCIVTLYLTATAGLVFMSHAVMLEGRGYAASLRKGDYREISIIRESCK